MNEPEILEAYRDLSTPVSAPADLLERVERRIKHRRTARRGVVALTVLAIAGGVGVQALGGGEGDGDRIAADPTTGDSSSLTFIDADGQPHTFRPEDIGLTCVTGTKRNGDPGPQTVVLARNEVITAHEQPRVHPGPAVAGEAGLEPVGGRGAERRWSDRRRGRWR